MVERKRRYVIRVDQETLRKFRSIGRRGQNDQDIILNLLDMYNKEYGDAQKHIDEFHIHYTKKEK